ncbi:MAG: tetratricopeptide repeat protein [Ignavibacteria bacterium]|nr:tetratricopeptide repeat protein [Ignavibacteria bacterium]
MNRISLFLLSLILICTFQVKSEEVIFTKGTYEEVLALAQKENKVIMIDFFTDWCKWCVELDNIVYKNEEVAKYANANQINWKIDAEKGEGIQIAKKYKVSGYPTVIFTEPDGTEIDRIVGFLKPQKFLETMKNYNEGINTIGKIKLALLENPNDVVANYLMGKKYFDYYQMETALPYLKKVMQLDPENKSGYTDNAMLYCAYISNDKNLFSELISKYPDTDVLFEAALYLAETSYQNDNNYEKALEYYNKLFTDYKDNEDLKFSYSQFLLTWIYSIVTNVNSTEEELKKAINLSDECYEYVKGTANESSLYYRLSLIYYKLSDYQKSLEYIDKAISIFDNKTFQQQRQKVLQKLNPDAIQK